LAEESRVQAGPSASFGSSLFLGRPRFDTILPFPRQSEEDEDQGDAFLERLEAFLKR